MKRPLLLLLVALARRAHAIDCGAGQYSNDTINCYSCPSNTFCQGGVVTPCPQYSVSPAGSSALGQCVCQPNSALTNGACMCNTGYVLDALSYVDGEGITQDDAAVFMGQVMAAKVTRRPSAGLGSDLRLQAAHAVGSGLELDGEVLQLTAYRTEGTDGAHRTPARPARIARPTRRRTA